MDLWPSSLLWRQDESTEKIQAPVGFELFMNREAYED
jgi:hypothetical protein